MEIMIWVCLNGNNIETEDYKPETTQSSENGKEAEK